MDFMIFLIGLIVGAAIGYGVFYFRYEDKWSIDWLRSLVDKTSAENARLSSETKELNEQNLILKEKVTELLMKNADLNSIVWELNRYYYYLKEWYAKATELVNMLKGVDPVIEEKIKKIVSSMESSTPVEKSVPIPDLKKKW
jgi:chromosome segregation ATPase